jgi:hypothetical protein
MTDLKNKKDTSVPQPFQEVHHAHLGPILGVLVLILALILGGLFLWGSILNKQVSEPVVEIPNNEPETPRAIADAQILDTTSPSDELSAIQADLESTNLELLDQDFQAMDAELDAALTTY